MMKALQTVLVASVIASVPANAEKIDLNALKCREYLQVSQPRADMILMWMMGFYTEVKDSDVIDLTLLENNRRRFAEFCGVNPNFGVSTAAEGILGSNIR